MNRTPLRESSASRRASREISSWVHRAFTVSVRFTSSVHSGCALFVCTPHPVLVVKLLMQPGNWHLNSRLSPSPVAELEPGWVEGRRVDREAPVGAPLFFRSSEAILLFSGPTQFRVRRGWQPLRTRFAEVTLGLSPEGRVTSGNHRGGGHVLNYDL